MLNIKKIEIIGTIFGIIFGSLIHFFYDWTHIAVIGWFSAVNESPWEHMKLLFFPVLIFLIVEWRYVENKKKLLFAKNAQIIISILFTLAFFYLYTGALGFENPIIDILSFIVFMAFGYRVSYEVLKSKYKEKLPTWVYGVSLALMTIFFVYVSYNPPQVPLFLDKNTGQYGMEK